MPVSSACSTSQAERAGHRGVLDSADEHTLFMGPGLQAGGTIEQGSTPRHFAYLLSAFESCGE